MVSKILNVYLYRDSAQIYYLIVNIIQCMYHNFIKKHIYLRLLSIMIKRNRTKPFKFNNKYNNNNNNLSMRIAQLVKYMYLFQMM